MRSLVGLCIYPRLSLMWVWSLRFCFFSVKCSSFEIWANASQQNTLRYSLLVFVHTRPHMELFDCVFLAFDILDTLMQETVGEFGNKQHILNCLFFHQATVHLYYFYSCTVLSAVPSWIVSKRFSFINLLSSLHIYDILHHTDPASFRDVYI